MAAPSAIDPPSAVAELGEGVAVAELGELNESSAVAEEERVFTWDELVEIAQRSPLQAWSLNSQALKFVRWMCEQPPGVIKGNGILPLPLEHLVLIGKIEHAAKGPGFSFDSPAVAGQFEDWSAAQFITQLRPDALRGLALVSLGVKKLDLVGFPDSVDKMRMTAAMQGGVQFGGDVIPPLWDFVLTRGDGATFCLHPSWRGYKCKVTQITSQDVERRLRVSHKGGVRAWDLASYPIRLHGRYQEGLDLVRDAHRKNQLQKQREKDRKGSPAVAGQSPDAGESPAVAGQASASPAPAVAAPSTADAEPTASSSTASALAPGESWWEGYRVKFDRRTWSWMYWTGSEWKNW